MSESPRALRLIVAAALALGIVAALGAGAAPPEPTGIKVAVFDPGHTIDSLNETTTLNNELKKMGMGFNITLQTLKSHPYLSESDQKRIIDLTIKKESAVELTAPEQADLKKLLDQSKALYEEAQALQVNKAPTPGQQQRITELTKLGQDSAARFESAQKSMETEVTKKRQDALDQVQKDVKEALAKVAKKDGITIVFAAGVAWYGETDLTEAVIKQVNSNAGPPKK